MASQPAVLYLTLLRIFGSSAFWMENKNSGGPKEGEQNGLWSCEESLDQKVNLECGRMDEWESDELHPPREIQGH